MKIQDILKFWRLCGTTEPARGGGGRDPGSDVGNKLAAADACDEADGFGRARAGGGISRVSSSDPFPADPVLGGCFWGGPPHPGQR